MQTALHLVRLLVILVRPHIVGQCSGQRIEGQLFKPVAKRWIAQDGKRMLQRKHVFDNGA